MLQGPHVQQDIFVCLYFLTCTVFLPWCSVMVCCSGCAVGWIAAENLMLWVERAEGVPWLHEEQTEEAQLGGFCVVWGLGLFVCSVFFNRKEGLKLNSFTLLFVTWKWCIFLEVHSYS